MGNCRLLIISILIGSLMTIVFYFTFAETSVQLVKGVFQNRDTRILRNDTNVRVFCFIPTAMRTLYTKGLAVKDTWSKKCDSRIFFSSEMDEKFPTVKLNVTEGLQGLTSKTMLSLQYIYQNHFNEADWFLKADDDTYIIVENLKYLLSKHDFNEPLYLGHHFKKFVDQGYMSGGAGYVLSREAVKRVATLGRENDTLCRSWGGAEDVALGKCLQNLGVRIVSSLDSKQRQTFHPFKLDSHLFGPLPEWYYNYSRHSVQVGEGCCSDLTISFHYVEPVAMRTMDFFLYNIRVHGQ